LPDGSLLAGEGRGNKLSLCSWAEIALGLYSRAAELPQVWRCQTLDTAPEQNCNLLKVFRYVETCKLPIGSILENYVKLQCCNFIEFIVAHCEIVSDVT